MEREKILEINNMKISFTQYQKGIQQTELPVIKDLLLNQNKRDAMRAAMQKLSQPQAAGSIASQLAQLAGEETL